MHDDENFRYIGKNGYIDLTPSENSLLKKLIDNKGKVVKFHKMPYVAIKRLRKRLKGEVEIKNKNGVGYYID